MTKREEIVTKLNDYYEEKGIIPDKRRFNCTNKDKCNSKGIQMAIDLAQGMQCHIGSNFGEDGIIKVLVVSLDSKGGKDYINDRTKEVEKGDNNPHMKRTMELIADILQIENSIESLRFYAMTNSCKCSRESKNDSNQLPDFFYEQCVEFKIKEIELIEPDIIYFQGKRALIGLNFENIDNQTMDIFEYIKFLKVGNKKFYAVQCIHPSARGRNSNRKKFFYNELLPQINEYLRYIFKN